MSETSWHSMRSLTRTDARYSTLFYGFFFVDRIGDNPSNMKVSMRVPLYERAEMKKIENESLWGLIYMHITEVYYRDPPVHGDNSEFGSTYEDYLFLNPKAQSHHQHSNSNSNNGTTADTADGEVNMNKERFGTFVLTTEKANMFHCFWRGNGKKLLIGLSVYPFRNFARQVFDYLGSEPQEKLVPTLIRLCECPILPACHLDYSIRMTRGVAKLSFSSLEQVEDVEIFRVAMQMLTPLMIISAWEAVILECKILVVSSGDGLVEPCCEFIRRLALPLSIVCSYIPHLSEQLINAIEAPFPYLYGINANLLAKHPFLDLSDTLILDLDNQSVEYPGARGPQLGLGPGAGASINSQKAPQSLIRKLRKVLSGVMRAPLVGLVSRPCRDMVEIASIVNGGTHAMERCANPLPSRASEAVDWCAVGNAVVDIFTRQNLSLLCAQCCGMKMFRREAPECVMEMAATASTHTKSSSSSSSAATTTMMMMMMKRRDPPLITLFPVPDSEQLIPSLSYARSKGGLTTGLLYLLTHSDTMPVWVEATDQYLSVYKWADELPMLQMSFKVIEDVSAVHIDPMGSVFELKLKNQITHRFQVGEQPSDARSKWMTMIDWNCAAKRGQTQPSNPNYQAPLESTHADGSSSTKDIGMVMGDDSNGNGMGAASGSGSNGKDTGGSVDDVKSNNRRREMEDLLFPVESSGNGNGNGGNGNGTDDAISPSNGSANGGTGTGGGYSDGGDFANNNGNNGGRSDYSSSNNTQNCGGGQGQQPATAEESRVAELEERQMLEFRHSFLQTQLLSYIESLLDPEPLDKYLGDITYEQKAVIHEKVNTLPAEEILNARGALLDQMALSPDLFFAWEGTTSTGDEEGDNGGDKGKKGSSTDDGETHADGAHSSNTDNIQIETSLEDVINSTSKTSTASFSLSSSSSQNQSTDASYEGDDKDNGKRRNFFGNFFKSRAAGPPPAAVSGGASVVDSLGNAGHGESSKNDSASGTNNATESETKSNIFTKINKKVTLPSSSSSKNNAVAKEQADYQDALRERKDKQELASLLEKLVAIHRKCKLEIRSAVVDKRIDTISRLVLRNYQRQISEAGVAAGTGTGAGEGGGNSNSNSNREQQREGEQEGEEDSSKGTAAAVAPLEICLSVCPPSAFAGASSGNTATLAAGGKTQESRWFGGFADNNNKAPATLSLPFPYAPVPVSSAASDPKQQQEISWLGHVEGAVAVFSGAISGRSDDGGGDAPVAAAASAASSGLDSSSSSSNSGGGKDSADTDASTAGLRASTASSLGRNSVGSDLSSGSVAAAALVELHSQETVQREMMDQLIAIGLELGGEGGGGGVVGDSGNGNGNGGDSGDDADAGAVGTAAASKAVLTPAAAATTDPLLQVVNSLLGHLHYHQGSYDRALDNFSAGSLLTTQDVYIRCIAEKFVRDVKAGTFSPGAFQSWAFGKGEVVALHAFRFIVHYLHERNWKMYTYDEQNIDESLALNPRGGSSFVRSNVFGGVFMGADTEHKGKHHAHSSVYTWVENKRAASSDTLNETVTCTGSSTAAVPCELSIYLATRIRDVFEAYMETPAIKKFTRRHPTSQHTRLAIKDCRPKDIKSTSAYQKFQIEVCELQRVSLDLLGNPNEMCMFFLNIYNTLTLHAIIDQGSPGASALERNTFCKVKYTIGSDKYSLFEIEHAFLRARSKKASIYGYVINPEIKESDPRAPFRLNVAKPFITFALFTATQETPPMTIFTDADNLDEQLKEAGRVFVRMYVEARRETYTITIPGVFKYFMEDFNGKDSKKSPEYAFVKVLRALAHDRLKDELEAILKRGSGATAKPLLKFNTKMIFSDPVIVL